MPPPSALTVWRERTDLSFSPFAALAALADLRTGSQVFEDKTIVQRPGNTFEVSFTLFALD